MDFFFKRTTNGQRMGIYLTDGQPNQLLASGRSNGFPNDKLSPFTTMATLYHSIRFRHHYLWYYITVIVAKPMQSKSWFHNTMLHDGHLWFYMTPKWVCPKHNVPHSFQWGIIIVPVEIAISMTIESQIMSKCFKFVHMSHESVNVPIELLVIPWHIPMKYPHLLPKSPSHDTVPSPSGAPISVPPAVQRWQRCRRWPRATVYPQELDGWWKNPSINGWFGGPILGNPQMWQNNDSCGDDIESGSPTVMGLVKHGKSRWFQYGSL